MEEVEDVGKKSPDADLWLPSFQFTTKSVRGTRSLRTMSYQSGSGTSLSNWMINFGVFYTYLMIPHFICTIGGTICSDTHNQRDVLRPTLHQVTGSADHTIQKLP